MPTTVNGLPAHVLFVHAVVVLVPLAALLLVASALWPAARRKLGFLTPLVALVTLILVPITTNAGQALQERVPPSALVTRHIHLGGSLLPWAIGIFVMAAAVYLLGRRTDAATSAAGGRGGAVVLVPAVAAVLAVVAAVGGGVQIYRIGDSGSQAVWHGVGGGSSAGR